MTCILTGFAKSKKYVGVSYACNGSDIPANQDFGTVQIAGPSATPYTQPPNTSIYTIVGKTPCGGILRKRIDTSYSARSAAGFKNTAIVTYDDSGGVYPWLALLVAHGQFVSIGETDLIAQSNMVLQLSIAGMPSSASINGTVYSVIGHTPTNGIGYTIPSPANITNYSQWLVGINTTLYYLDSHITWTYDLV